MLEFFTATFRKDIRPVERSAADLEAGPSPRDPVVTAPEAHIAWLAGAPYARVVEDDKESPRFVSLLVPFY